MFAVMFDIGVGIFMLGWIGAVSGHILWLVERRSVRRGWRKAATAGLLLTQDRASVANAGSLHQKRIELDQALADTLLFAPTSNYYHPFALDWFGRAHRTGTEFLLEARLSVGQTMSLAGWLVSAVATALLTTLTGWYLITAAISPIVFLCVRGNLRSFRSETQLSRQILGEVRNKLQRLLE